MASTPKITPSKSNWPVLLLVVVVLAAFFSLAWLSLQRYWGHNTRAFDLGMMSQSIWGVQKGLPLVFTAQGVALSRLARHVELFYFALAPLYALFPSPATLLVVQAGIYSAAGIPVYRLAKRHLVDWRAATALVLIYLLYPVAQTAVLFEFHADTLAMGFLLFAIEALDRRAWGQYALWLGISLSCKFYVAVPVAVLGVVLWLLGERRAGLYTFLAGSLWGLAAFFVIRPLMSPADLVQAEAVKATIPSFIRHYFGRLGDFRARLANALITFLPAALFFGWRAPLWLLPAAAVWLPVVLSSGPGPSYLYSFHHYALGVPFAMAAIIYGAADMREKQGKQDGEKASWSDMWFRFIAYTLLVTFALNLALVDTPLSPRYYLAWPGSGWGQDTSGYGITPRDDLRRKWIAENVPDEVPVAADRLSGLHLVNRETFYLTHAIKARTLDQVLPEVDFVVTDALFDFALGIFGQVFEGGVTQDWETIRTLMKEPDFHLLAARDGLLLFGRGGSGLTSQVEELPGAASGDTPLAVFDGAIALTGFDIEALGGRKFRAHYSWTARRDLAGEGQLFAVSQLEGLPDARIVHLPTLALDPVNAWPAGHRVRETLEFEIPVEVPPGRYELTVAWYNAGSLFAAQSDLQSRVGQAAVVGTIEVK